MKRMQELIDQPDRRIASVHLGRLFVRATAEERTAIRAGWDFGVRWPYPNPARLACSLREESSSRDRIISSLVLDSLQGVFGSREHLIALSATYRSCELAGLSPAEVFDEVAAALPPQEAAALSQFLQRAPSARQLSSFGLVEKLNVDGEVEIQLQDV